MKLNLPRPMLPLRLQQQLLLLGLYDDFDFDYVSTSVRAVDLKQSDPGFVVAAAVASCDG